MSTEFESNTDQIIMKYIGEKSPAEISDMTGLTREQVLRRKNELLEEIDVLTVAQTQQKIMVSLQSMATKAQSDYEKAPFEFKAGLLNASIAALKQVSSQLNRVESQNKDALDELNAKRVRELLRLFDVIVAKGVKDIAAAHGLDEDSVLDVFQGHIITAAAELDAK